VAYRLTNCDRQELLFPNSHATNFRHWRSYRGKGHRGHTPPLEAYSVTQNNAKKHQNTSFSQKIKHVLGSIGEGHTPSLNFIPVGKEPPPHASPLKCPTTTRFWLLHSLCITALSHLRSRSCNLQVRSLAMFISFLSRCSL